MKLTSNSSNNISIYLFISVLFYYPIAACIISLTNLPSTPTNIGIRALFSIISVILIFKSFFIRASTKFNTFVYWLLLFWVIYAIRVLYDVVILEIPCDGKSSFLVLSMVFANCFLPMLAILVTSKKINLKTLMTYTYYILIISNVLIIIKVFLVQDIDESFFYRRAEVKQLVDGEDVGVLNPITIGFTGNLLAILALSKLLILKVNKGRTFDLLVLFLGLINLVVGASRGPFIIFLLILFLILYRHFKITQYSFSYNVKLAIILILLSVLYIKYIHSLFVSDDKIALISRVFTFLENVEAGEKEERNYSIEYAWQDFKNNPVIGSQYVGTYDNFYPHNIIIEVFMATGIIGAFCFFMFIFGVVKKIILHYPINYHYLEFQYILIPTLFIGLTSGSLMFSSDLWLTVALYLCINRNSQQTY